MRDNFNKVAGTFIDAESRWITADYPQVLAQTDAVVLPPTKSIQLQKSGRQTSPIGAASNAVGVTFTATGVAAAQVRLVHS